MNDTTYLLTSLLPSLEFVFDVPTNLMCNKCDQVAIHPWRAKCKHLLCWKCLNEIMRGLQTCHVDGTSVNIGDVTLEKEIDDAVRKLHVRCPYQKHGCGNVLPLRDIPAHLGICNFLPVYCPKECGITVSRKDLVQHIVSTCPGPPTQQSLKRYSSIRSIKINSSQLELLSSTKHQAIDCDAMIMDLQCQIHKLSENVGQLVQRMEMQTPDHHCHTPDILIKKSESVKENCNGHHNVLSPKENSSLQMNNDENSKEYLEELQMVSATNILNKLLEMVSVIMQRIDGFQNRMLTKENLDQITVPILERADILQSSLRLHYKKLENLESKYDKLKEKHIRVLGHLGATDKDIELVVKGFEDFTRKLDTQNRIWLKVIDNFEKPSLTGGGSGEMIWKISEYTKKKRSAAKGTETELYSPSFYSHSFGYKLCLRAYLNGYFDGEGSHLSLYICIVKGPYDDIVPWPFKGKFTFYLLDQRLVEKKEHFTQFVDPKKIGNNFTKWCQRPQMERNVGFGLPEFISHAKLEHVNSPYLRNDTIYLKVVVDYHEKS